MSSVFVPDTTSLGRRRPRPGAMDSAVEVVSDPVTAAAVFPRAAFGWDGAYGHPLLGRSGKRNSLA